MVWFEHRPRQAWIPVWCRRGLSSLLLSSGCWNSTRADVWHCRTSFPRTAARIRASPAWSRVLPNWSRSCQRFASCCRSVSSPAWWLTAKHDDRRRDTSVLQIHHNLISAMSKPQHISILYSLLPDIFLWGEAEVPEKIGDKVTRMEGREQGWSSWGGGKKATSPYRGSGEGSVMIVLQYISSPLS